MTRPRWTRRSVTLLLLTGLLAACATARTPGPQSALASRTVVSPTEEWIVVNGGNRAVRTLVLLPDDYPAGGRYPLLLAIHNFGGDADGFGKLIHAERLRRQGAVVVLPQAAGVIPEWQGPGITITFTARDANWRRIDDVAGIARVLDVVQGLYKVDPGDINIVGFSQGATVALDLTRRLDRQRPAAARRLFLDAGSVAGGSDGSLALEGTDLIAYEPGRNGMQTIANVLTWEPSERVFMPEILAAKGCTLAARDKTAAVDDRTYRCRDGRTVRHIFEARGEHAWPGQAKKYDSLLMGIGSRSAIDFTNIIVDTIFPDRVSAPDGPAGE